MARLYDAFSSGSALESVALMATTILPILLLQQPHTRSQTKDHIRCLERRLKAWKDGDLAALVKKGRTIQQRFLKTRPQNVENENRLARRFTNLMFQDKTHAALDLLANCGKGGVLCLDQPANPNDPDSKTIREALASKHPTSHPASPNSSLLGPPPKVHPVVFDSINAHLIRSTALRTSGAAGPSGLDAHAWRRMCTAFKAASKSLCQSLADVAKRLCSSLVDPEGLGPLLACRLIALNKCPGAVIAQELKEADGVRQVLLHPAATQFITILSTISLFLRDGRKWAAFYSYSLLRTFVLHLASPSCTSHVVPPKPEEIFIMPGMYKLYQLFTVFSSRFLGRIQDKFFFITYSVWTLHWCKKKYIYILTMSLPLINTTIKKNIKKLNIN